MRSLSVVFAVALASAAAFADGAVLIRHGTVYAAAGRIADADVLVVGGRIKAIGHGVPAPQGARIVEAKGKTVTPGLFATSRDLNATANVADIDDPDSALLPAARKLGVTRIVSYPADCTSVFCGPARIVRTSGDFDTVATANAGVWLRLEAGGKPAHPDLWGTIADTFEDARAYGAGRGAFFRPGEQRTAKADVESLQPVLRGEVPLLAIAEHADVITRIARFAEAAKLRLVVFDGGEAWKIAGLLKALRVPVVASGAVGAGLDKAGVETVLLGRVSRATGTSPLPAKLPPDRAVAAATRAAADAFAASDAGTLAPGLEADLVVWNGAPGTAPVLMFVHGNEVLLRGGDAS